MYSSNEVQADLSRCDDHSSHRVEPFILVAALRCCIYLDVVKVVENIVNTIMFLSW